MDGGDSFLMIRVSECHPITKSQHIFGEGLCVFFSNKQTTHIHLALVVRTQFSYEVCVSVFWTHSPQTLNMAFLLISIRFSFFLWHQVNSIQLDSISFHSLRFFSISAAFFRYLTRHRNVSLFFFLLSFSRSLFTWHNRSFLAVEPSFHRMWCASQKKNDTKVTAQKS